MVRLWPLLYLGSPVCWASMVFMALSWEKCWLMSVWRTISMQRFRNSRKSDFCMWEKILQSCSWIILKKKLKIKIYVITVNVISRLLWLHFKGNTVPLAIFGLNQKPRMPNTVLGLNNIFNGHLRFLRPTLWVARAACTKDYQIGYYSSLIPLIIVKAWSNCDYIKRQILIINLKIHGQLRHYTPLFFLNKQQK